MFNNEFNLGNSYKPRNLKIESSNGYDNINDNKYSQNNFEYVKSI